jgi:hypothetical protein
MARNKNLAQLLSFCIALSFLGASNHCVFEFLFASITKTFSHASDAHELEHHLASHLPHKHEQSSDSHSPNSHSSGSSHESHAHGQPHTLMIKPEKGIGQFANAFHLEISFIATGVQDLVNLAYVPYALGLHILTESLQNSNVSRLLSSLHIAPQAPPLFV